MIFKLKNSTSTQKAVLRNLMIQTNGNLAFAQTTPKLDEILDDIPMVLENVFTGRKLHFGGLRRARQFMFNKGLVNPENPSFAEWYVYPLE